MTVSLKFPNNGNQTKCKLWYFTRWQPGTCPTYHGHCTWSCESSCGHLPDSPVLNTQTLWAYLCAEASDAALTSFPLLPHCHGDRWPTPGFPGVLHGGTSWKGSWQGWWGFCGVVGRLRDRGPQRPVPVNGAWSTQHLHRIWLVWRYTGSLLRLFSLNSF